VIIGVVLAAGVVGRSLLGRPWVVEARPANAVAGPLVWRVAGWRRSGRLINEVAEQLASGLAPAPAEHAVAIDPRA
jgi:hypothetical protein